MYRILGLANYEDRFVIPTTHREYAENAYDLRGGCGFSDGEGCTPSGLTPKRADLFGSRSTVVPNPMRPPMNLGGKKA